jgi:DNA polymerase-4
MRRGVGGEEVSVTAADLQRQRAHPGEAWSKLRPELRGRPVAVVPVDTDATCAIAASYEAKAFGIRTGTPIHEAKNMCPGLICVLAQHERYVDFHRRILEEVDRHIPVSAVCSIDEVACRLMDNEVAPERVAEIAQGIKRGLAERIGPYVRCSIGVAPNRYLAKIATDMQKPDGFVVLSPADMMQRLAGLQLRDLPGIGRHMEKRLYMAGIYDMPQLLALGPAAMRKAWGSVWGERMWYLLRGVDLPEEETTRSSVGHSHVLSPELRAPEKARFVARRLTLKLASRLRRLGYYASTFCLSVRLEEGGRLDYSEQCYRAQDSLTFLHIMERGWAAIQREARARRIKKTSVSLFGLVAADALQPELFGGLPEKELAARRKAEKMSEALDKVNHRFGRDSVLVGMLPSQGRSFSGTKIAFTRITDQEEFLE